MDTCFLYTLTVIPEGDIKSLKDCPLQVLDLSGDGLFPSKFTGKNQEVVTVLPQGNTSKQLSRFLLTPSL